MTQTLKKELFEVNDASDYYKKFYKAQNKLKPVVLNYLFRNISFLSYRDKVRAITINECEHISKTLNIPYKLVHKFISEFLINLLNFRRFLNDNPDILRNRNQNLVIRIILCRFYRLAPVFDCKRAKENAHRLKSKLDNLFFWPQIMTQIAIVIFITDLLDKTLPQKIIQTNLRALCSCSAYAFHRTRNKIGLTSKFIKNLVT
ncbi:MAG: hypothetical protein ACFE8C_09180 [Promethearchaeota archaeon]